MLAVVVDDYAMKVTDVIRGDDHLTNTFKQLVLYNALSWKAPNFSHIPLIYGSDGAKLSKRHGAQSVLDYQKEKMFPEALNNYLLRLGWGYKNKEFFTTKEAIELFNIKGIGKSPSRFDPVKLLNINSHYFKQLTNEQLLAMMLSKHKNFDQNKLIKLIELFKSRAENIDDIEEGISYMHDAHVENYSNDALKIIAKADNTVMCETINELKKISLWNASSIENVIKDKAKENNIKIFNIAAPIRSSVTGKTFSPSIFLVLEKLGKKVSIERLKKIFL